MFIDRYADYIDDAICTGDMNDYLDDSTFISTANMGGSLYVIGNHDSWMSYYDEELCEGTYGDTSLGLIKKTLVYNKWLAPYIDNWGVVQPVDAATDGKCYYYKDYTYTYDGTTTTTLRLIVLDCMHYGVYTDLDANQESIQNAWLTSILADANTNNIPVVIACHYAPAAYTVINCSYNSSHLAGYNTLNPIAKATVDNFISNGGTFICWIVGHEHADHIGMAGDQLVIVCTCARTDNNWDDGDRVLDTKTQDAFNFIAFDTSDKLIKMVRIGADYNNYLQRKRVLTYRYEDVDASHQKGIVVCE